MDGLDFTRAEYDKTRLSDDVRELAALARHPSSYIAAQVAYNEHTSPKTRDWLRENARHPSIIVWLLSNHSLTLREYRLIFDDHIGQAFDFNIHPSLAEHKFATFSDLQRLLEKDRWNITMAVLNNRNRDNITDYKSLIKGLLAPEGTTPRDMNEVQRLAHLRYHGVYPW